jgi:uncharacterized protein YjbI with pentapeptide repeats
MIRGVTAHSSPEPPPKPLPKWIMPKWIIKAGALLVLVVAVAVAIVSVFVLRPLYGGLGTVKLDVIRTGGTLVALIGGAVALWLTARRQHYTELALLYTERDATERRITELYTKAADQLGSDKAPVRLAGLYALERLAQNTPQQRQRQTIVDVICAYLRMPYAPPEDEPPAEDAPAEVRTQRQELQVRMTAQRILGAHLRLDVPEVFWACIDIDLTEAHLHKFDLVGCQVKSASFKGAQFSGDANCGETRFDKGAVFSGARFDKRARFDKARFGGDAAFSGARFGGDAAFSGAIFYRNARFDDRAQFNANLRFGASVNGDTDFEGARFGGHADFDKAEFGREVNFRGAQFKDAFFCGAQFDGTTYFNSARFDLVGNFRSARFFGPYTDFHGARFGGRQDSGEADFSETQFSGDTADFGRARFGKDAVFSGARFGGDAAFSGAIFYRNARFDDRAQFNGDTDFEGARFGWVAEFRKARFGGAAYFMEARFGGTADFGEAQFDKDPNFQGAQAKPRRHSWPAGWTTRGARMTQGEKEGWVYLVRVEGGSEQQPDRNDSEAGTSGKT